MKDLRILYRLYVFITRGKIVHTSPSSGTPVEVERIWRKAA